VNSSNTLILGIGNTLLSDEGAGIHAMYQLQSEHPGLPHTVYIDGGTLSFTLAVYLQDCSNVIVLDAAELKSPPGTVRTMIGAGMDKFLGAARRSPHEVSLLDLMDIARLTESLPVNRALIGIQPQSIEWGLSPTPAVEKALPIAVSQAVMLISLWNQENKQTLGNHPYASLDKDFAAGVAP
jgi:hydrogenase maturation protease